VIAHDPGDNPAVGTMILSTVPSALAVRLMRASLVVASGLVNHDTIPSPGVNPRIVAVRVTPTCADTGEIVASMGGGSEGITGEGRGTSGVGSGPP